MRYILLLILVGSFCFSNIFGNNSTSKVKLICNLEGCGETLSLYQFDGGTFTEFMKVGQSAAGVFTFELETTQPMFYYLGVEPQSAVPIIIGTEALMEVDATCGTRLEVDFTGSPLNTGYLELKDKMNELRQEHVKYVNQYRQFRSNPENLESVKEKLKELDDYKVDFLDSLKVANPYFAKIVALNTYISYQIHGEGYPNEVVYFTEQFFQFADLSDEAYNHIPWVYEAFKGYSNTLSSVGISVQRHHKGIKKQIEKLPLGSRARKLALSAVVTTLKGKKHPNFIKFAEQFIAEYQELDPMAAADLQKTIDQNRAFSVGGQAPDFTQQSPDGEDINLSDFKGKLLLVDFWASWCGPCRKENPNVVAMYEKYKDKGFEILGVSLDKNKERWIGAIEKDGLTWPQVSDLKGWSNKVAQLYGVRSIPHTILLDEEGKIIARNLRGRSLEEKLEELFGQP